MANRDEFGRFVPGHNVQPEDEQRLTPKRNYARDVYKGFREHFPPERLLKMTDDAWSLCMEEKDASATVRLVELLYNYTMGKPSQTIEIESDTMQYWQHIIANTPPLQLVLQAHAPARDDEDRMKTVEQIEKGEKEGNDSTA